MRPQIDGVNVDGHPEAGGRNSRVDHGVKHSGVVVRFRMSRPAGVLAGRRSDPAGQGMAARSLTKALARSSAQGQVLSSRRVSPLDLWASGAATCRIR